MSPLARSTAFAIALWALSCMLSPVSAQVYKWVDERGVTHYGEKPPANKGQPLTLRDATGGASKPAEPPAQVERKLDKQERDFQRRQAQREQEAAAERRELERRNSPSAQRARKAECQTLNRELAVIRSNPTAFTFADESRVRDSISRNCP